jgi:hypothetical protein
VSVEELSGKVLQVGKKKFLRLTAHWGFKGYRTHLVSFISV